MDGQRFDALARTLANGLPRRRFLRRLGAGTIAALGLGAATRPAAASTSRGTLNVCCQQWKTDCCTSACVAMCDWCVKLCGIAGGGVVRTAAGDAHLALFATRLGADGAADGADTAVGLVRWVDPVWHGTGLTLESLTTTSYGPLPDAAGAREVRGTLRANGTGDYPYVLRVVDAGPGSFGQDTVALAVGDQAVEGGGNTGFSYGATGALVGGDLALLDIPGGIRVGPAAGTPTP